MQTEIGKFAEALEGLLGKYYKVKYLPKQEYTYVQISVRSWLTGSKVYYVMTIDFLDHMSASKAATLVAEMILDKFDDTSYAFQPVTHETVYKSDVSGWHLKQKLNADKVVISLKQPAGNGGDQTIELLERFFNLDQNAKCPDGKGPYCMYSEGGPRTLRGVVIHLNDTHKWTREKIADWLESTDLDLTMRAEPEGARI